MRSHVVLVIICKFPLYILDIESHFRLQMIFKCCITGNDQQRESQSCRLLALTRQSLRVMIQFDTMIKVGSEDNKPLCGKLDDSVELSLQGSRAFAHLDVFAVLSDRRVYLCLGSRLSLLQGQEFGGR